MFDEEPDGDPHGECAAEIHKLRDALLTCARQAEALKRECGMDPESAQAIRNAQYQVISTTAHLVLGTMNGPDFVGDERRHFICICPDCAKSKA